MTHTCIRPNCGNQYEDDDPEPYYCASCIKSKKILAAEIDKKLKGSVSSREAPNFEQQIAGMKKIGGIPFINL